MKKIFIFILLAISAASFSQTFPDEIDTLIGGYTYESLYGNIPQADDLARPLLRAQGAYINLMFAVGTGNTAVATAALADLNALLGTSYAMPTFNFDETAQSYISVDSLKVGDGSYVDSLITNAGVLANIATYNILTTSDTSWIQDEISDSVQAAITTANAYTDLAVSGGVAGDSTWISGIFDTLIIDTRSNLFYRNSSNGIGVKSGGVIGWNFLGYGIASALNNGVLMPNTSSSDIRFIPNQSDDNTGFTWDSADKLELQAGDSAIIFAYEVGGKLILDVRDSMIVRGNSNFIDSVYLTYAIDAEADEQWVGLSATGGLFGDSISDAGFGLTDRLIPIKQYLSQIANGELSWRYMDENGSFVDEHGISGRPNHGIQQLQWGIEHSYRYIDELDTRANRLEKIVIGLCLLVVGLFVGVVYLIYKNEFKRT